MNNQQRLALVLAAVLLVAVIAVFAIVYGNLPKTGPAGQKTVSVTIVTDDGSEEKTLETAAETLGDALKEANLIVGTESEYGLYITAVNGIAADEAQQQWWCLTKGGETLSTGADTTPIADGDAFELTLTTGW